MVLVDFENDNIAYPVIIGLLYRQDMSEGSTDITADSLKVNVNTNLSENTLIGSVTPESIRKLNDKYTNNVKKVVVEYSLSNYQDHYDSFSQWSEQAPQYWPDKYMWQRTTVTYENDTVTRSMTCIQAKGESGSGTTIEETYVKYAISNNGTTPPSISALNTWYDDPPQTTDVNPYLWSWTYIRYSDGNVNNTFGVSRLSPNSIILYLYKRSPTVIDRIDWQNNLTYNFDTKQFVTLPSGWSAEIPSGNDPIYVTAATATSIQSTDTIAPGEWSTPMLFTKSGFNSKTIQLYKRGLSAPNVPSVSVTYTFSDGSISPASPDGWSLAVPTTDGNPCYVIQATAISYENTDTILSSEWSTPTVLARDGNSDYIDEPIVDWYIATATTNPPLTPTTDIEIDNEWTSLNWTKNISSITLSETNKYLWNSEVTHYTITGYVKTNPHILTIYAETGNGIASSTVYYFVDTQGAVPPSASAAWSTTFPSSIQEGQYLWTKTVIQYTDSSMVDSILYTVSKDGETGTSISITSTSVSYQASTSGTTTPSGTWYSTVSQTGFGDNYPYLWTRTVVNYSSGQSTTAYSVGYKGQDGADGTSVTILGSYDTLQELEQAHPTGSVGDAYMVGSDLYVWSPDSSSWVDVGQIRGDPGQNAYVHFAWATDAQGTGFSLSYFSGAAYCGTYSDDRSTDSTIPSDYVWQRILGENGTSVSITSTSVDYAIGNSSTDHSDSHLYGSTGNKWVSSMRAATDSYPFVWTRTTVNYSDSTTTLSYSVGYKGTDAVTIVSTTVQYQKSNDGLNPPLTWSTDIVAPTQDQPYLWTKTQVVYSDSTLNTTSYSVSKLGADGQNGAPGTDGTSAYVHFAYANSSDGQTDFTVTPVPGVQYLYIGVLSNDTQADSLIYSDYRWSLIKGADGSNGQNTAIVYLYKRSSTAATIDWNTTLTYSFVNKSLQSVPSGWSQTIPSGSNPLYVTAATAASTGDTDTITKSEWASPVILAQNGTNGQDGADGLNSATIFLYQRAATAQSLTKPTQTLRYVFADGTFSSGNLGNWSRTVPVVDGNPCFMIQAAAISTQSYADILPSEWSNIVEFIVDGQDGTNGANIAVVYLYRRSDTAVSVDWTETLTYNFNTKQLTSTPTGWSQSIPAGNNPLYVTAATASSSDVTDNILYTEWASPVILVQNGTDGFNTATVFLYQRAQDGTTPAKPSSTLTYDFSDGTLAGNLGNWSRSVPASDGRPCYVIQATAVSRELTDTIAASEWSTVVKLVEDGADGSPGTDGLNTAVVYLYKRSSSAATINWTTNLTYNFTAKALTSTPSGWSQVVPTGTDPIYVTAATASSRTNTDTIAYTEWATPVVLAKNGEDGQDGQPGTNGTNGLNSATVFLYQRASENTTPSRPTSNLIYTFSTGAVSGTLGSWSRVIPQSDGNPCYVTQATAISNEETDTITPSEWSSVVKLVEDGQDGAPGNPGTDGLNTAVVYLYKRSASAATINWTTTLTYNFSSKALQSTPTGWSQTIPTGTDPVYVTAATASSRTNTDTIPYTEWVSPVVLVKDGQDGAPGTNGTDGLNSATVFLYQRATSSSSITKPTVSLTYEFSTGILTGNLGNWSRSIPASNGNPCFVIQATAISSSTTDTIEASEWSDIAELVVDGQDGVSSVVVLLDNEAHTFAGTTTTAVASSITVNVKGYVGTTLTACNIGTISNVPTGMTVTKNNNNTTSASLTIAVTTSLTTASGSITIPVTCGGVTINKSFSYSIAFKGEDGKDSVLYSLTFSSSVITSESGTLTPSSITINAYSSQGASTPSAYSGRFRIQSTTNMSSWTDVYSSSSNQSSYSYSTSSLAATVIAVRVQLYQAGGFTTLLDQQTIPILIKGSDGRGITSIVEWYALSTTAVRPTTGWTTTFPTMDATNRYLWNYSVITYTDGSTSGSQSDALIIGAYGESVLSLEIQSDNGTLFNSKTTDTTLTAVVYLGVAQLTVNNNGSVSSGGTTVGQLNWFAKERFTGNGVAKTFDLGLDILNYTTTPDIKITIDGTITSAYTITDQNTITFTTAPSDESVIIIEYLTSTTGSLYIDRTDVRNQVVITCKLISDTNTLSISEVTIKDLNDATSLKSWYMLTIDNVEFISEPSVIYDALDYTVVPTGQYQYEQYDSETDQVITVTEDFTWQDSAPIVNDSNVNKYSRKH